MFGFKEILEIVGDGGDDVVKRRYPLVRIRPERWEERMGSSDKQTHEFPRSNCRDKSPWTKHLHHPPPIPTIPFSSKIYLNLNTDKVYVNCLH
jgi:hypothetical protein